MKNKLRIICIFALFMLLYILPAKTVWAEVYEGYEYVELDDDTICIKGYCGTEKVLEIPEVINGKTVSTISILIFNRKSDCPFEKVIIPKTVQEIEAYLWWSNGYADVSSIQVDENNPVYDSRDDCNAIIHTATGELIRGCENTVIPEGVRKIGSFAFGNCYRLEEIQIPDSVTSIDFCAFTSCKNLKEIIIPNSLKRLDTAAFSDCKSVERLFIPASVTEIISNPFTGCDKLEEIVVSYMNPVYDSRNKCNAIIDTKNNKVITGCKNTVIPKTVKSIGDYAYDGLESITDIVIPESITSIESHAFDGCSNLSAVTLPKSLQIIGDRAFHDCFRLKSIVIPVDVETIGEYAFYSRILRDITIYGNKGTVAEQYAIDNGIAFEEHAHTYCTIRIAANANTQTNGLITKECSGCFKVSSMKEISYPQSVTLSEKEIVYDGKVHTPTVTVKNAEGAVINPKHYDIVMDAGRKKIGVYTCTIRFKGNYYKGSKSVKFVIRPRATSITGLENVKKGITIRWKQSSQATGYKIYRSTDGTNYVPIKTISDNAVTEYTDVDCVGKGTYYYKVYVYNNASGTQVISAGSSVKKQVWIFLERAGIQSLANEEEGISITFKGRIGQGYKILRSEDGKTFDEIERITIQEKGDAYTYTDTNNLVSGKKYVYKICLYEIYSGVEYTSEYSTAKAIYRMNSPKEGMIEKRGGQLYVKWVTCAFADGYEIEYSQDSMFETDVNQKVIDADSKQDTQSTTIETDYSFTSTVNVRVRAYKIVSGKVYYSEWRILKKV